MHIPEETHLYISLHQKDERIVRNPLYEHMPVRILISKTSYSSSKIQQFEFTNGIYDYGREVTLEEFLYPGDYVMTVEVLDQKLQTDGTSQRAPLELENILSFYAKTLPENVEIQRHLDVLDIQKKILKNMALHNPRHSQKIRTYEQNGEPNIKIYNDMVYGLIYFYYMNQGNKKLREQVTMTSLENLQI